MLKRVSAFFDFFVFTHLFIGFAAVFLTLTIYSLFALPINWVVVGFNFISTVTAYNFSILKLKLKRPISDGTIRQNILSKFYPLLKGSVVTGILGILVLLFYLPKKSWVLLSGEAFLVIFYSIPIFRFKNRLIPLRKIPYLKTWILSVVWSISSVGLPLWMAKENQILSSLPFYLRWFIIFLFIFINALLFDIRDLAIDRKNGLKTLSGKLGLVKTKKLALGLILFLFVLNGIGYKWFNPIAIWSFQASFIALLFLILKTNEKRSAYFYMFWTDGVLMLPYFCIIIYKGIFPH